ncbi:hypothetical protein AB7Z98_07825 [Providencia manganoxydans]|uniref:hypothetical protein n=1 Tax=Providencia manganoxydans TaxID=2923283 RepID=UPI0034E563AA
MNKQGLSAAARAWDKHAARPDGFFEPLNGNPAQKMLLLRGLFERTFKRPK